MFPLARTLSLTGAALFLVLPVLNAEDSKNKTELLSAKCSELMMHFREPAKTSFGSLPTVSC